MGRGIPRTALNFYDVKSELELERYGITFLSAQDLASFHHQHQQNQNMKSTIIEPEKNDRKEEIHLSETRVCDKEDRSSSVEANTRSGNILSIEFYDEEELFDGSDTSSDFSRFASSDEEEDQLNIYQLVEYYMQHHTDGNYFLDEVPLLQNRGGKYFTHYIKKLSNYFHTLL
jgi:hypothetical protein